MRDLLYYEKAKAQLKEARRQTKIPEYRAELSNTIRFTARRIEQIKRGVLVTVVLLLVMLSGCCTVKGVFDDLSWATGQLAGNIKTEQSEQPSRNKYWSEKQL